VRFLALGKLPDRVEPTVTVAFRHVLERFRRAGWAVVADVAAGTRQPMFGWAGFARTVLVVVEPSAKSILTARRLVRAGVGTHLVVNKLRPEDDLDAVRRAVPLPLLGCVPFDPLVVDAECHGQAPIDASQGPAVTAIAQLSTALLEAAA
jgi:CO dehydrogenase maturation factor